METQEVRYTKKLYAVQDAVKVLSAKLNGKNYLFKFNVK